METSVATLIPHSVHMRYFAEREYAWRVQRAREEGWGPRQQFKI